jgi:hypothetical protein
MGTESPEGEAELIAGFLSRQPLLERSFLQRFRPWLREEIRGNFQSLWPQLADLEQSALMRLCEMREPPANGKDIRSPLKALAKYLVNAPARVLKRERKPLGLRSWDGATASTQEASSDLKHLLEIAASLPRGMAKTVLAKAAYEMGEAPPLHEQLGIDVRSAGRRLSRAQNAVMAIAQGEDVQVRDE